MCRELRAGLPRQGEEQWGGGGAIKEASLQGRKASLWLEESKQGESET